MSVEALWQALWHLRDQPQSSREEIADAAIWATQVLGCELLPAVVDRTPRDALDFLIEACRQRHAAKLSSARTAEIGEFLRSELVREAISVELESCTFGVKGLAVFTASELPRLRELEIERCRLKSADLAYILAAPVMRAVERLSVRGNVLRDEGASVIAGTDLPALRALDTGYTRMTLAGVTRLVESPNLRGLRAWMSSTDKLGAGLGRVLARGPSLANLRAIRMFGQNIGNAGLSNLVEDPVFRLRSLLAFECGIGESAIRALAASPAMSELAELRFRYDPIRTPALIALCESRHLGNLRVLQISQCGIDDEGLAALASSSLQLEYLNLATNRLPPDAIARLGRAPNLRGLRHLVLDGHHCGDAAIEQLADSAWFPALESLSLQHNDLTDAALEALARWPQFRRLRELKIGTNSISDAGIEHLSRVDDRRLEYLELWQTGITPQAMADFLPGVTGKPDMTWQDWPEWPE